MGNVRQSYTAREKLKVIAYAKAHGNRAGGRQFSINEASVRLWRSQRDRLQQLPKTKMAEIIFSTFPRLGGRAAHLGHGA